MNRNAMLWGGLAATLVATWYAAGLESADESQALQALPRAPRPAAPAGAAPAALTPLAPLAASAAAHAPVASAPALGAPAPRMGEPRMGEPRSAFMPVHSWRPPPPPPPPSVAVAPPPPQAPPLPFRYLGRLDGGEGGPVVFLAEGNLPRPHVLRVGERLRDYQVESIGPQAVVFVYLPLNQKQQLLLGTAP